MKNKNTKAKTQIIFGALFFALFFTAEVYVVVNYPQLYLVIAILAVAELLFLYMVVWAIMVLREQKEMRREEQYESIFKSEKASYLMLKKYFEEIEDKLNYIEKAAKVPTEEIINAQKGIAKVIVNRHKENSEALMSSNDMMIDQIKAFDTRLSDLTDSVAQNRSSLESNREVIIEVVTSGRDQLLEQQRLMGDGTEKAVKVNTQEIEVAMKDMELRLNGLIAQLTDLSEKRGEQQTQEMKAIEHQMQIAASTPSATMPEPAALDTSTSSQVQVGASTPRPAPKPVDAEELDALLAQMNSAQPAQSALEAFAKAKAAPVELTAESEIMDFGTASGEADEPEAITEPEEIAEMMDFGAESDDVAESEPTSSIMDTLAFEAAAEEAAEATAPAMDEADLDAEPEVSEPAGTMGEILDFESFASEFSAEPEADAEGFESSTDESENGTGQMAEIIDFNTLKEAVAPEDTEPKLEMLDFSTIEPAAEPSLEIPGFEPLATEPLTEPTLDIPEIAPIVDEPIEMPDMAALDEQIDVSEIESFAAESVEPAEDIEPLPEEPISMSAVDLSDPNKPMSPDDIAALLASMGA